MIFIVHLELPYIVAIITCSSLIRRTRSEQWIIRPICLVFMRKRFTILLHQLGEAWGYSGESKVCVCAVQVSATVLCCPLWWNNGKMDKCLESNNTSLPGTRGYLGLLTWPNLILDCSSDLSINAYTNVENTLPMLRFIIIYTSQCLFTYISIFWGDLSGWFEMLQAKIEGQMAWL